MTYTAKEALSVVKASRLTKHHIPVIDRALQANALAGWPNAVVYSMPGGKDQISIAEVLAPLYEAAGWQVTVDHQTASLKFNLAEKVE